MTLVWTTLNLLFQNLVNYIIRVIRFGLPSRAVAPFILGVCRLIWLGHLVPTQLQKLSHAGAELCSSGNIYLAQENSLESLGLSHEKFSY